MQFAISDKVEWTSQAGGWTRTKRGTVGIRIPTGCLPRDYITEWMADSHLLGGICETVMPRNHDSYLVSVPANGKGKPTLYWPRVSNLRAVEAKS
jgi:hypothetical protein